MTRPLLALLALALVGCSYEPRGAAVMRGGYSISQIRGCEYISVVGVHGIVHAGDCRNPIHAELRAVNDTIWQHTWIGPNTSHGPDSVHARWTGRIDGCIDADTLRGRTR